MTVIISVGKSDECTWIIQNKIYEWFVNLVQEKGVFSANVSHRLTMSFYTHGLALDEVYQEDPVVGPELSMALRVVAKEIAAGDHVLVDAAGNPRLEMQSACNAAFERLGRMLDACCPLLPECLENGD